MGRTPQRHCPRCDKRRMLIAVEKIRGEDLFRCLCRECAEDEGHMWEDSSKEEASWPPEEVEDEHDARETS